MPEAIKEIPINVFLLALLWTAVGAAAPAGSVILMWAIGLSPRPDWITLWHQAASTGVLAGIGFWRKHKAYLSLPPTLREVKELVATAQVIEQAGQPTIKVTTLSETHTEPLVKE